MLLRLIQLPRTAAERVRPIKSAQRTERVLQHPVCCWYLHRVLRESQRVAGWFLTQQFQQWSSAVEHHITGRAT